MDERHPTPGPSGVPLAQIRQRRAIHAAGSRPRFSATPSGSATGWPSLSAMSKMGAGLARAVATGPSPPRAGDFNRVKSSQALQRPLGSEPMFSHSRSRWCACIWFLQRQLVIVPHVIRTVSHDHALITEGVHCCFVSVSNDWQGSCPQCDIDLRTGERPRMAVRLAVPDAG